MSDRSSLAPLDRVCAFLPKLPKSYAARGSCSTSSCPSRETLIKLSAFHNWSG